MTISAISALSPSAALQAAGAVPSPGVASSTSGTDFASSLAGAVDSLQASQSNANTLAVQAVTGQLDDVHTYTIAAAQASVSLELASTLRNKAVDAFNEIMRMQA